MSDTELTKILISLLDRPVAFMTDQQLDRWLRACDEMEHKANPVNSRQSWTNCRAEAKAEIARRKSIDAEVF